MLRVHLGDIEGRAFLSSGKDVVAPDCVYYYKYVFPFEGRSVSSVLTRIQSCILNCFYFLHSFVEDGVLKMYLFNMFVHSINRPLTLEVNPPCICLLLAV